MDGIRIDELDATVLPSRDHVVPAMKDGLTVKLTVGQILDLLGKILDPDEVGSKALFAALNLSDLDDPEQARENLGATEVGDALLTAASKAAGRSAIDALGPDETPDKAFRRGNILGTVSQSGGVPTGALMEQGNNANGTFERYANGLQICRTVDVSATFASSSRLAYNWTFPAAFVDANYCGGIMISTVSWDGQGQDGAQSHHYRMDQTVAGSARFSLVSAANFLSSNTATLRLTAIGRLF